jgi:hypothetical protein
LAAKMSVAATVGGREVSADSIGILFDTPSLRCLYCGAPVGYVPRHTRESRGKMYSVKGYFRLQPKAVHDKQCMFAVDEQLKIIARRSLGLLQALEGEQYRFRLVAIEEIRDLEASRTRSAAFHNTNYAGMGSTSFGNDSRRFLSAYINSATRVIQLRALCPNHSVLRDRLELVFNGMSVRWEDSYYEPDRFIEAYQWLRLNTVSFPIALVGQVSNVKTIETHGRLLYLLNLAPAAARPYPADSTIGELTHATIWTSQPNWFHDLKPNDRVVVLAIGGLRQRIRSLT